MESKRVKAGAGPGISSLKCARNQRWDHLSRATANIICAKGGAYFSFSRMLYVYNFNIYTTPKAIVKCLKRHSSLTEFSGTSRLSPDLRNRAYFVYHEPDRR